MKGVRWLTAGELSAAEFYPDIKAWLAAALEHPQDTGTGGACYLSPDWV